MERPIHRQTSQPQNRQWILRQPSPTRLGKVVNRDGARGHGRVAHNVAVVDRDVGCTNVVKELILTGISVQIPVQISITGAKARAIVGTPAPSSASALDSLERPNSHFSGALEVAW